MTLSAASTAAPGAAPPPLVIQTAPLPVKHGFNVLKLAPSLKTARIVEFYQSAADAKYYYVILVEPDTNVVQLSSMHVAPSSEPYRIRRRYEDFALLHKSLLKQIKTEFGAASRAPYFYQLPSLPPARLFVTRGMASERVMELDHYVRVLFQLPEKVTKSLSVAEFFGLRKTDMAAADGAGASDERLRRSATHSGARTAADAEARLSPRTSLAPAGLSAQTLVDSSGHADDAGRDPSDSASSTSTGDKRGPWTRRLRNLLAGSGGEALRGSVAVAAAAVSPERPPTTVVLPEPAPAPEPEPAPDATVHTLSSLQSSAASVLDGGSVVEASGAPETPAHPRLVSRSLFELPRPPSAPPPPPPASSSGSASGTGTLTRSPLSHSIEQDDAALMAGSVHESLNEDSLGAADDDLADAVAAATAAVKANEPAVMAAAAPERAPAVDASGSLIPRHASRSNLIENLKEMEKQLEDLAGEQRQSLLGVSVALDSAAEIAPEAIPASPPTDLSVEPPREIPETPSAPVPPPIDTRPPDARSVSPTAISVTREKSIRTLMTATLKRLNSIKREESGDLFDDSGSGLSIGASTPTGGPQSASVLVPPLSLPNPSPLQVVAAAASAAGSPGTPSPSPQPLEPAEEPAAESVTQSPCTPAAQAVAAITATGGAMEPAPLFASLQSADLILRISVTDRLTGTMVVLRVPSNPQAFTYERLCAKVAEKFGKADGVLRRVRRFVALDGGPPAVALAAPQQPLRHSHGSSAHSPEPNGSDARLSVGLQSCSSFQSPLLAGGAGLPSPLEHATIVDQEDWEWWVAELIAANMFAAANAPGPLAQPPVLASNVPAAAGARTSMSSRALSDSAHADEDGSSHVARAAVLPWERARARLLVDFYDAPCESADLFASAASSQVLPPSFAAAAAVESLPPAVPIIGHPSLVTAPTFPALLRPVDRVFGADVISGEQSPSA